MGSYTSEAVKRFMDLALKCCEDETRARPSILEIVRELENICSILPESDTTPSELTGSSSIEMSNLGPTQLDFRRNLYVSSDYPGSDLISGVIPTINPR